MAAGERRVIVLGATGSIGRQTIDVIEHLNALHARGQHATALRVVGLAAGRDGAGLTEIARRTRCGALALRDERAACGSGERVLRGEHAAETLVREVEADVIVAAMVGSAGLPATLAGVELGRDIALANKETLVAAGELVVAMARRTGSRLLPVDSEHSGLWQCLHGALPTRDASIPVVPPMRCDATLGRAILTASGGPFRTWTLDRIARATPDEALNHPTWRMGRKVTIDSASLMNKALELVEAHWLFGLGASRLGVLVHPQSLVHAIVELADGSSLAQMGAPDMRGAIQHALAWPARPSGAHRTLDWRDVARLDFEEVDAARFPAPGLALRAIDAGGTSGAILNAANEAAVEAFLAGRLGFARIGELVERAMDTIEPEPAETLGAILHAQERARAWAQEQVPRAGGVPA